MKTINIEGICFNPEYVAKVSEKEFVEFYKTRIFLDIADNDRAAKIKKVYEALKKAISPEKPTP